MVHFVLVDEKRLNLPVLSQDEHTLVVVKPAGMPTELTTDPRRVSLIWRVRSACAEGVRPRLVHRLDRVTRGVVVAALTKEAAAFYGEQIREGMWEKYYVARIPSPERGADLIGMHKAHIKEEGAHARIVRSGGKPSLLEVVAIDRAPGRRGESHALIRLITGRLHQVRVMLAALGLPLIGDELYGGRAGPMYLEHTALWYVDYATREFRLAHLRDDPERESLGPAIRRELERVMRRG